MRMYDIIMKKRGNQPLSDEEIAFFVNGYTDGTIPDYQASALLMAIWFKGMNRHETAVLTDCMAHSGDMVDLSPIEAIKVDKHSTGGVGDKTTLVVAPIVAACGIPVAKMSGRGLGHTGGTIDKLESIPGFCVSVTQERFFEIVRNTGLSIISQTGNIAPADKKIYALRDVTATVDSLPLIASSIMSKKLASGADAIVLDVKTGSGAFMKTKEEAIELAKEMVSIGEYNHKATIALITDMNVPLGYAIGNSLEVVEAVETLQGKGPSDLESICIELAANMLHLAGKGDLRSCRMMAWKSISEKTAFSKFCDMVTAQGGDATVLRDTSRFPKAPLMHEVVSPAQGYIVEMQTELFGVASMVLGAGRKSKEDSIDPYAGIGLCKKTGDFVQQGDVIARLYTADQTAVAEAEGLLLSAIRYSAIPPHPQPLILARVTKDGVE